MHTVKEGYVYELDDIPVDDVEARAVLSQRGIDGWEFCGELTWRMLAWVWRKPISYMVYKS